jgi:hypothetical protein
LEAGFFCPNFSYDKEAIDMNIDPLGNAPLQNFIDIKVEKKHETAETRTIEKSEKSEDSNLDTSKQNNTDERKSESVTKDREKELLIYDTKGKIAKAVFEGRLSKKG